MSSLLLEKSILYKEVCIIIISAILKVWPCYIDIIFMIGLLYHTKYRGFYMGGFYIILIVVGLHLSTPLACNVFAALAPIIVCLLK